MSAEEYKPRSAQPEEMPKPVGSEAFPPIRIEREVYEAIADQPRDRMDDPAFQQKLVELGIPFDGEPISIEVVEEDGSVQPYNMATKREHFGTAIA